MHKILFSIGLDEWYHACWCTGSRVTRWPTTEQFYREYYGTDRRIGELVAPVHHFLEILDQYRVKGTLIVLGEVA